MGLRYPPEYAHLRVIKTASSFDGTAYLQSDEFPICLKTLLGLFSNPFKGVLCPVQLYLPPHTADSYKTLSDNIRRDALQNSPIHFSPMNSHILH